jgi:hypothetical protein
MDNSAFFYTNHDLFHEFFLPSQQDGEIFGGVSSKAMGGQQIFSMPTHKTSCLKMFEFAKIIFFYINSPYCVHNNLLHETTFRCFSALTEKITDKK